MHPSMVDVCTLGIQGIGGARWGGVKACGCVLHVLDHSPS